MSEVLANLKCEQYEWSTGQVFKHCYTFEHFLILQEMGRLTSRDYYM